MRKFAKTSVIHALPLLGALCLPALAATPPKNIISESRAKEIALREASGTVKSSKLEVEEKQWVYSFDIQGSDNRIHEIHVNAKSGKIVQSSIETPAEEAAEEKSEGAGD